MKKHCSLWISLLSLACAQVAGCGDNGAGGDGAADGDAGDWISDSDGQTDPFEDDGAGDPDVPDVPDADAVPDTVPDGVSDGVDPDVTDAAEDGIGPDLPRGLAWVRTHPMFLSGLTVQMDPPPASAVNVYFDDLHANAVHLWETGLPTRMDGWREAGHPDFRFVSWVAHNGTSHDGGEVIGGYPADTPGRIGFQIGDEPLTMAELLEMEAGVNAVRAADPNALIFVNFSYRADEIDAMLDYYCHSMDADLVCYDSYSRANVTYGRIEMFRTAALACDMPYWRYLNAYEDAGETDWPSESDMRWNAFVGLVYGYTGHTWFIYQILPAHGLVPSFFTHAGDFAAPRTQRFDYAAQINIEMMHLGKSITQLNSTDVRYIPALPLTQPEGTRTWSPGAGGDLFITEITPLSGAVFQDVLVGFFNDDSGEKYFMVQNVNHSGGDFPVSSDAAATIHLGFDFGIVTDPAFNRDSLLTLNKLTGSVDTLPLTPAGGDLRSLDVTLAAGDAILLKYNTGAEFAMQ